MNACTKTWTVTEHEQRYGARFHAADHACDRHDEAHVCVCGARYIEVFGRLVQSDPEPWFAIAIRR